MLLVSVVLLTPAFAADEGSTSFWEKTKVMGSVDVNYNYNFNRPTTTAAAAAANGYRVFDVNPNTFNIGLVDIALENSPADWVTFRTDLDFGRNATFFHAAGFGAATDVFDLQQAYVALKANQVGNGLGFKIGKFVTLHGMEVIEAASNYNISRGLLFNYAIPFTHTGVVATYPFSDMVSLDLGIVNGWNNVLDNNNGKTAHGMLTVKPNDEWTFLLGGTFGPETAGNDRTIRSLLDTSLIYKPMEDWTLALNYNWARDGGFAAGGSNGAADWQGLAAYADWKATDMFGLTLRTEYFDDDVGALGAVGAGATASGKLFEGTLTSHTYLMEGLDLRFEFRHDQGNNNSFLRGTGAVRKFQDTIASQLVYSF
ncbi:MAG: porin [Deltaproteobacteria bacterium]|nr:porin [Deltaproteobacteria bacterium]